MATTTVKKRMTYPWEKWFDGKKHHLKKDTDYKCDTKAFCCAAYMAAKKHKKKLDIVRADDDKSIGLVAKKATPPSKKKGKK